MSPPSSKKSTRKVGAPYGNHNALKHGFYSPHFRSGELSALQAVDAEGLQDEIAALRIYLRRFIESSAQESSPAGSAASSVGAASSPDSAAAAPYHAMIFLDAIGLAATRLAYLLKTQKLLDRQSSAASVDLNQALAEVMKELGLRNGPKPG